METYDWGVSSGYDKVMLTGCKQVKDKDIYNRQLCY